MVRKLLLCLVLTLSACSEVIVSDGGNSGTTVRAPRSQPTFGAAAGYSATPIAPPSNMPSDVQAAQFARSFLNSIQATSIARRAEMCGYFYITARGTIAATSPVTGTFAGCEMPVPQSGQQIFASYHTHSAYAPGYDNEVPSAQDLLSDFQFGIDGYVSTPGGRIWHVDYGSRTTEQVCGLRCVYMDPGFRPEDEAGIRARYTVDELQRRSPYYG